MSSCRPFPLPLRSALCYYLSIKIPPKAKTEQTAQPTAPNAQKKALTAAEKRTQAKQAKQAAAEKAAAQAAEKAPAEAPVKAAKQTEEDDNVAMADRAAAPLARFMKDPSAAKMAKKQEQQRVAKPLIEGVKEVRKQQLSMINKGMLRRHTQSGEEEQIFRAVKYDPWECPTPDTSGTRLSNALRLFIRHGRDYFSSCQ